MKKSILLLFLSFSSSFLVAQLRQGEITLGKGGNDIGNSIIQTEDGGYAIAGQTVSFGIGGYDVYVAKLDSAGNVKWTRTIGGTGDDVGNSIIQTKDGGYTIAGTTNSYGAGGYDIYVVKLDSIGNLKWTRTIGGAGNEEGNSIVQTKDGGYAIAGNTTSYGAGGEDIYVIKLDSTGKLIWTKTIGGAKDESGSSITGTKDGGYAIIGCTNTYGFDTIDNEYVIKLDSIGNIKWTKTYSNTSGNWEIGHCIIQTTNGGYATTGYTGGSGYLSAIITKLDSLGNVTWNLHDFSPNDDAGYSIVQTKDKCYAISGFEVNWHDTTGGISLVKIDSSGNVKWNEYAEGTGGGTSLVQTKDYGYALTGYMINITKFDSSGGICEPTFEYATIVPGKDTVGVGGIEGSGGSVTSIDSGRVNSGDTYNAICLVESVNDITPLINNVAVYPNPNNGKFTIQSSVVNNKLSVEVYNMLGEMIYSTKLSYTSTQVDLSNNSSGIYLYRITTDKGQFVGSGKLVIER